MKYILFILIILCLLYITNTHTVYDKPSFLIDVVYTWAGEKKSTDMRLRNNNELKYSLRSVIKYAPWINRIYIVMNPPKKIPSWFNDRYKEIITIVDHNDIYPSDRYLPTTNSNSIETVLHNIPELSEHFIYFNDDMFLGNYINYTDFFTKEGKAVIASDILNKTDMLYGKDKLNLVYPDMVTKFYYHVPYPLIKSEYKKYTEKYKDFINWIRNNKNRNGIGCDVCIENNLKCPCQQYHYPFAIYMYDNNKAVTKDFNLNYGSCDIRGYINNNCINYLDIYLIKTPKMFCIQDDGIIYNNINNIKKVNNFFKIKYNKKVFFEK